LANDIETPLMISAMCAILFTYRHHGILTWYGNNCTFFKNLVQTLDV